MLDEPPLFLLETLFNNYLAGNVEQTIRDGQYLLDIKKNSTKVMEIIFWNYFTVNKKAEAIAISENIYKADPSYEAPVSMKLWYELVKDNKAYIEKTLQEGSHQEKFIIHNFYGAPKKAATELRLVAAEMAKNKHPEITIPFTDYLKFSKNKLYKNYQEEDWFIQGIAPKKERYDSAAKQFPRAAEVLKQLNY